jgi:hypothetical protein
MSELSIITDHKYHNFKYRNEVPGSVLKNQFDYQDEEVIDGFFQYKGNWYHLDEFMGCDNMSPFVGWSGYSSDSFFSGILIKLSDDGEQYMVGWYCS